MPRAHAVTKYRIQVTAAIVLGSAPGFCWAGNGTIDIGYGPESVGMGGADIAVASEVFALNINPAGLTQISNRRFDLELEPFFYVGNKHVDDYGNNHRVDNPVGVIASGGYAWRFADSRLVLGVGTFVQGGVGFIYKDLHTAFATQDDLQSILGSFKLEPGFGWQATDHLSVGAAVGLTYSSARQKFFSDTSFSAPNPEKSFFGFRTDQLSGWAPNFKLGFQYRFARDWVLGAAYTSRTDIKLEGGTATFNYDAIGQGRVKYRQASQTGLHIPQQSGLGLSYRPNARWLLGVDFDWLDWSDAMNATTLIATHPDNPDVPQHLELDSALDWRDQYVVAVGAAFEWSPTTTLRFGYNQARNPIPSHATNPLLAVIAEDSITAGFSHAVRGQWKLSGALHYHPPVTVTYTNSQLPFGTGAVSRWESITAHLVVSRQW